MKVLATYADWPEQDADEQLLRNGLHHLVGRGFTPPQVRRILAIKYWHRQHGDRRPIPAKELAALVASA